MRLKEFRENIDKIDDQIVELFEKRMQLVKGIANYKKENNIQIENKNREEIVIKKAKSKLDDKELEKYIEVFMKDLMKISKKYQEDILCK